MITPEIIIEDPSEPQGNPEVSDILENQSIIIEDPSKPQENPDVSDIVENQSI